MEMFLLVHYLLSAMIGSFVLKGLKDRDSVFYCKSMADPSSTDFLVIKIESLNL